MLSVNQELFIKMPIMNREHKREEGRIQHSDHFYKQKHSSPLVCFGIGGG